MDWRDLIDERYRRDQARRQNRFATISAPPTSEAPQEDDGGGFFGGLKKAVGNVVKAPVEVGQAVGGFFGNMVKDVVDTGETAIGGIKDVIEGTVSSQDNLKLSEERLKMSKENNKRLQDALGADYDNPNSPKWQDPAIKRIVEEGNQRLAAFDQQNADRLRGNQKEFEESQKVDPLKTAAASAETFLNVATLGVGKSAAKQGVKTAIKQGAKEVAEGGAKYAAKKIGQNAAEGALIGGAYGALHPVSEQGREVNPEDMWRGALFGGAAGGALGGGLSFLDKNVRAGAREIPGAIKEGGRDTLEKARQYTPGAMAERNPAVLAFDDQYQQLAQRFDNTADPVARRQISQAMAANRLERGNTLRGIQEGGYIKLPGGSDEVPLSQLGGQRPDNELQTALEKAWNSNDLEGAQSIIDRMSPDMKTSMQALQDAKTKAPGAAIDTATTGADAARRQLAGEDITRKPLAPAEQEMEDFAQDMASRYKSADEYIRERAQAALSEEGSKGVSLIPDGEAYGYGMKRVSEHAPWYSDMYGEFGRKPSLRAVSDRIENALANGTDGGGLVYPEESRVYQLLKDREAGMQQTIAEGPPPDMAQQFMDNLAGTPETPSKAASRTTSTRMPSGLPKGPQEGQAALVDNVEPYAGYKQDLTRPALPAGEPALPPTPKQAKARFKKDGEIAEYVNRLDPGKTTIELPSTTSETSNIAVRQTKGGKLKPLATNNAHITKDDVAAIRAVAADDTGSAFTTTRTPDMNLEEAFRKRGGTNSKEFQSLARFNTSLREHTASYTTEVETRRGFLEKFLKEFKIDGPKAQAMRPYLEAKDAKASQAAITAYREQFGDEAADGLRRLRNWWRTEKDVVRTETNAQIEKYAGKDRMMGDLGESYVPRVYRSGTKGFKDAVLDIAHGGMDKIGGKNGLFNLQNDGGYLSKETETMGGVLRGAEGIPLNSELAKPNTTFLSAAQKRVAKSPVKELEDPITSMMRYFEATARAKHFTEDIARGRTIQKAIEMVNNETGNLRQMYKSFDDQINAVAGKTSRLDRPFVDSETGNKIVNVATKLQSRIARSTILGSAQSAFAQTGQMPLIAAENGANNFKKGMSDMIRALRSKAADPMEQSALMKTRYPKFEEMFAVKKSTQAANKATRIIAKPFRLIEHASSELAWRSSYNRAIGEGLTGKEAIQAADRYAAKIIGERSAGARAALYESKALGPVTSYTLEVNQLYQVAKQYFKRDPKKAAKLVAAIWLYNQGYKAVTGNKLNADPIDAALDIKDIMTSDEYLDDEGNPIGFGERVVRSGGRAGGELLDATPLGGPVAGALYPEQGFRVPFGGGRKMLARDEVFGDTNFGRYGGGTPIASGLANPLLLLGIPGMGQLQRSVEGSKAYNQGYSETPSGDIRFDIEQNPENYWRALLLGMYGTKEGREYLRQQQLALAGYSQQ